MAFGIDPVKILVESPACQAVVVNLVVLTLRRGVEFVNANQLPDSAKVWLQPVFMVLSGLAYVVSGMMKGKVEFDEAAIQNLVNVYANVLMVFVGGKWVNNDVAPKVKGVMRKLIGS